MSAHVEWLPAAETAAQVFALGDEWVGSASQRRHVLTLAHNDVVAVEGTPAQLRAFAARICAVVAHLEATQAR